MWPGNVLISVVGMSDDVFMRLPKDRARMEKRKEGENEQTVRC